MLYPYFLLINESTVIAKNMEYVRAMGAHPMAAALANGSQAATLAMTS